MRSNDSFKFPLGLINYIVVVIVIVTYVPSKRAGSDQKAFWLRPVMAITASYGHYGQRAARIGPDRIITPDKNSGIRFGSFVPKKGPDQLCRTGPYPMWTT